MSALGHQPPPAKQKLPAGWRGPSPKEDNLPRAVWAGSLTASRSWRKDSSQEATWLAGESRGFSDTSGMQNMGTTFIKQLLESRLCAKHLAFLISLETI